MVSGETAGGRPAAVVRATFRIGRGKLDILFRTPATDGGALVRDDTG